MRRRLSLSALITALTAALTAAVLTPAPGATAAGTGSAAVQAALADAPVALLQGLDDLTGNGPSGTAVGSPAATRLPNGDPAMQFDGKGQHLRFADRKAFEIDATGVLTVDFWMRPDALQFADEEGSGYVYTMGKGAAGAHEWYTRMYSKANAESRPNRISGYAFNPAGGLGAGSYFQDTVTTGKWIHVTYVVNSKARSTQYPLGYTKIYRDGVLRDTDSLQDYDIVPRSGTAPLRIGTGYLNSYFQGAIGNVAFYDKELTPTRIQAHHAAMYAAPPVTSTPPPAVTTSANRTINGTNVARRTDQLIRYTPAAGASTRTNAYGAEAVVVGGKVTALRDGVGNAAIPATGYVLSGHGTSRAWLVANAPVGAAVQVSGTTVTITRPAATP